MKKWTVVHSCMFLINGGFTAANIANGRALVVGNAIAAVIALDGVRRNWGKRSTDAPRAINVVNGIVLPMPDDPRWEEVPPTEDEWSDFHPDRPLLKLGPVLVCSAAVSIDDRFMSHSEASENYGTAVTAAYRDRLAREALARQSRAVDEFMTGET